MLHAHSTSWAPDLASASRRHPYKGDDYANELYVQDLITLSAVPARSRVRHRASVSLGSLWQFMTRCVRRRLG